MTCIGGATAPFFLHLDEMQGSSEAQTEVYMGYSEGALQLLTPQRAKRSSGVSGSARKQAASVQGEWRG